MSVLFFLNILLTPTVISNKPKKEKKKMKKLFTQHMWKDVIFSLLLNHSHIHTCMYLQIDYYGVYYTVFQAKRSVHCNCNCNWMFKVHKLETKQQEKWKLLTYLHLTFFAIRKKKKKKLNFYSLEKRCWLLKLVISVFLFLYLSYSLFYRKKNKEKICMGVSFSFNIENLTCDSRCIPMAA